MPYDALGNYIPGDEPSIDQMQYELAKKGQAPRPLDKVTEHFKNIVTQFNPIMMPKVMQDVGTIGTNIASTIVSPYADILSNVQASGAAGLHRLAGNEQAALEAEARQRQVTPSGLMREPALPVVREFEQGLGKAFEASKLPPLGPGSGMPGTARISPRPLLTPDDVRVLGAEATRVGRQVVDIPTDFVNAQSGLQRIDLVTGQPVLGARIQAGVDRLGDIMEQRRMQGLTPIPGLPAALQPETSMYAVRKSGSKLTTPTLPETAKEYVPDVDPVGQMLREISIDPNVTKPTPTMLDEIVTDQIKKSDNPNTAMSAFRYFQEAKALELFPDAPNGSDALMALKVSLYDDNARNTKINELYNEFIQTPEGQEFLPNAASTGELAERHEAAVQGLKNMWGKYLVKNLGTEGNPAVKMAAQEGLTYLPADEVIDAARSQKSTARSFRRNAGTPIEGSFATDITALQQEIETLNLPIKNAANAEQSLLAQRNVAKTLAEQDPSMIANFKDLDALHKEAKKSANNLVKQKTEIQKKLDKLILADAYETLEDASVAPIDASTMMEKLPYAVRQFYPDLKEAAKRGEMSYTAYPAPMKETGIIDAAKQFYDDVLANRIPKDKAPTYPVDRYIHGIAKERVQNIQKYRTDVFNDMKSVSSAIPENKQFNGNVGVIELTKDTPEFVANKEAALSTEALDICIGEGGGGSGTRNFFTKKKDPRWTPIVDILTGKPNPNASRYTTSYVQDIYNGGELPMFRDLETGMPIAALQFMKSSSTGANGQPKFNIGYASGAQNGAIEPKYIDGIRDYLNTRADDIAGIGENLEKNAGIYDTRNKTSLNKSRSSAQVSADQMKTVDWNSMPRFMTAKDIKQAVQSNVPAVAQQSSVFQEDIGQLQAALVDNIDFVINEAIQDSNLDAPEELERRLGITFSAMQSQYFPTLLTDPISSLNRALEYLEYEIDRRSNNVSEISQEMAVALERYAAELESARDDLVSQQQRAQQPQTNLQTEMQQHVQLQQVIEPRLFAGNARVVNDALRDYSRRLQDYASNQALNGLSPLEIADSVRTKINEYRNTVLRGPTINTQNFIPDELGEYVSELRQMIDNIGRFIDAQQQPQTANLPAEVQQNIDRRNQYITNAYQTALTPNTRDASVDTALSEFSDLLDGMATNMFGNGYNASEIAENLADRIHAEHMALVTPDRIDARGLTPFEADMIRSRLNDAYGNLNMIREMGVPAAEQGLEPLQELPVDFFEPDDAHGANEPYTMQSAIDMAQELFEQERIDANNFDIRSIEDSIHALREGLFDDERIRMLSPREQASFSEDVAFRLQNMLDEMRARQTQPMDLNTAYNTAEAFLNEQLENVGSDRSFADLDDETRNTLVSDQQRTIAEQFRGSLSDDDILHVLRRLRENHPIPHEYRQTEANQPQYTFNNLFNENTPPTPVPAQPATAPYRPISANIAAMSDQAITADMTPEERNRVQVMFETLTDVNMPGELQNIVSLARSHAMGFWENFSDVQREWLARNIEEYIQDNTSPPEEPPQRRGPFRPGGASAVRGVPLGNLNIQPSITAEAFRGPDRQPVSNFLQQVKSMPGVTQEGLKTGLMAFENMDPSRQMTKAEFARELLPSSYDIVDLANSSNRNEHDLEYLDDHLDDDDVIDQFKETHDIPENLYDDISADSQYEDLSGKLQRYLAKKGIRNEEEFNNAIAAVRREIVEAQYETYLAENYPGEDITGDPYQYRTTQRLALDSEGDEYSEFGVTHPDQSGRYTHYPQAPEGVIGHVRGTYNPDGLEVKTTDADIFTTKSNSYVIEEIQSDAQKNSQQVAHLHQVHGVLFKAAIQKALELGADTVYLPTAKVIASERPSVEGWEARPDDRGLTMQVPIRKDTTSKFKPIYDQAIVKEGLKPLLKIPGVTSKLVSDGDYHEISFTPEAKEYILNGPGQTIPGYKKGGTVQPIPSVEQMKRELMMRRA